MDAALAAADVVVDETYTTPTYHNHPLEPLATIAVWDGDRLTLYDANQGPHGIRGHVATAFGVPPERVRVVSPYVGGGFGCKCYRSRTMPSWSWRPGRSGGRSRSP